MIRNTLLGGLAVVLSASSALAQAPAPPAPAPTAERARQPAIPPQPFASPEHGFAALAAAAHNHDQRGLLRILGSAGQRLVASGDAVADRAALDQFAAAYAQKAEILLPSPGRAVLQVGTDAWPLPIPMRERDGRWRFDAAAGAQTIIDRRIGRNELDTIETLRAIADAQHEYAATAGRRGALRTYASRFFSTPGQQDGLYWPTAAGEPPSPLGPLAAAASAGGYSRARQGDAPRPFHGYVFRMLYAQGPAAAGGAMDYRVNGQLYGGFAVLAYPARYGSTGIKTFMISHHGAVWERDLGPDTARAAAAITRFDPGEGWSRVAE